MCTSYGSIRHPGRPARWLAGQVGARALMVLLALMAMVYATGVVAGATLQIYTSFKGQLDTDAGWDDGQRANAPMAEPTIAVGQVSGQTRLFLGADNTIGQFFNALQTPADYHNAQQSLASVFSGLLPPGYFFTEPQLLHDQSPSHTPTGTVMLDRYLIVAHAINNTTHDSRLAMWVTKYDSVSEAGGCLYSFNVNSPDAPPTSAFADSPRVGMSSNAVLLTADMWSFADQHFQDAKLWVLPKASLYNDPAQATCPPPPHVASLVLAYQNADGTLVSSVVPAKSYQNSPVAYLVNASTGSHGAKALTLWELNTTDPTVITGTFGPVPTNPYFPPPHAQQAGTSVLISTWDTRLFNAVYQPGGGLWTVHTTACTPDGDTTQRACLQWYQLDPGAFSVVQQGLVEYPGYHFYAPAITATTAGDAVLVFNGSASTAHVGIYFVGHHHTDPPNSVQHIGLLKDGEGCYERPPGNTVSLHSAADLDPIHTGVLWIHSAYVSGGDPTCQHNDWTTAVAAVGFTGP